LNYENGKAATPNYTPPIEVLINASKVLRSGKKEKEVKLDLLPTLAPLIGGMLQPFSLFKSTKQHFM